MKAAAILARAAELVDGDRHETHGDREEMAHNVALLWTWWKGQKISDYDAMVMLGLVKIARMKTGDKKNIDNPIDTCGYFAIAGELCEHEQR